MAANRVMSKPAPAWALKAAAILALVSAGCGQECLRHSDCPSQLVCGASGACEVPPLPDATPDNTTRVPHTPEDPLPGELGGVDAGVDAEGP